VPEEVSVSYLRVGPGPPGPSPLSCYDKRLIEAHCVAALVLNQDVRRRGPCGSVDEVLPATVASRL
jgi:hypothetical protein